MSAVLDPAAIYTAAQVAAWLQHPTEWFYRNRAALMKERGFPQPLSKGQPRWSGAVLIAWAQNAHVYEAVIAAGGTPGGNVLDMRTEAMRLEARGRSAPSSRRA